ncbi:MAG: hypothetical protein IKM97_04225 [Clostridia bacterium]|nr:hypothetical protein [Clostridia bacterium]
METMSKFRTYTLWFIGLFIISVIFENALLKDMYKPIAGTANGQISFANVSDNENLDVSIGDARATKMNGYVDINIKNTSGHYIDKCCVKLDLYTVRGNLASTKYIDVSNFEDNETRTFRVKFSGNEIGSYGVSLVEDSPDKSYVLDLFGFELDLRNILGINLGKIVSLDNLKETGVNLWGLTLNFLKSVPTWTYIVATGIVLWYLPSGFLFGIFP